jgi:NDP-sugar pyrophosphorylase family protein
MKALLICPSDRDPVRLLAEAVPLSNLPLLGQSILEYWLASLAALGVKQVSILAHDRPEQVQALAGNGERWGLHAEVIRESRELTPAQALLKYETQIRPTPLQNGIVVLDHFPGLTRYPLFNSYEACFAAMQAWMPLALTPERVGVRQLRPGIWAGSHSHVSAGAELRPPCWLGDKVFIGAGAVIGPDAIIEDSSFVEGNTEITKSYVGRDTFIGRYAELSDSLAWGNTLINWRTGSVARVPDAFLLCALRQPSALQPDGWFGRIAQRYSRNKEELQMVWKHMLMDKES